jgi:nucleoid-associated protein YgaU
MSKPRFNVNYSNYSVLTMINFYLGKLDEQLAWYDKQLSGVSTKNVRSRTHIVTDDDTLRSIALKYYGDVNVWKKLASFNGIDDLRISAGDLVKIPDKDKL